MPIYVISGVLLTLGSALLMVYLDPATSEGTIIWSHGTRCGRDRPDPPDRLPYRYLRRAREKRWAMPSACRAYRRSGASVIALGYRGPSIPVRAVVSNLEQLLEEEAFHGSTSLGAVAGAQSVLYSRGYSAGTCGGNHGDH